MNTKNNKRRQASREKIEKAFIGLLQTRELNQITVSDICKLTGLNRSTFYANYADIYELADTFRAQLEMQVRELYDNDVVNRVGQDYLRLFTHIRENQLFYWTYFKLGYDTMQPFNLGDLLPEQQIFPAEHMAYHIEFHKAGINAIIKKWLQTGCQDSPQTMVRIIESEYHGRNIP